MPHLVRKTGVREHGEMRIEDFRLRLAELGIPPAIDMLQFGDRE